VAGNAWLVESGKTSSSGMGVGLLGRRLASDHGKGNSSLSELSSRHFDEQCLHLTKIIDNQVQLRDLGGSARIGQSNSP
jgi:hypothetical protein